MNNIIKYFSILLLVAQLSSYALCQDLGLAHGKAIKSLDIEKNFKGFSYSIDEGDVSRLKISLLPGSFDQKELIGIVLNLDGDGKIKAIEPFFRNKASDFEPSAWALDKFKADEISFEALWEVVRSAVSKNTRDRDVISFLIGTIHNADGYPALESILIRGDGPVMKALKKMAALSNREIKAGNLAEVKQWLAN